MASRRRKPTKKATHSQKRHKSSRNAFQAINLPRNIEAHSLSDNLHEQENLEHEMPDEQQKSAPRLPEAQEPYQNESELQGTPREEEPQEEEPQEEEPREEPQEQEPQEEEPREQEPQEQERQDEEPREQEPQEEEPQDEEPQEQELQEQELQEQEPQEQERQDEEPQEQEPQEQEPQEQERQDEEPREQEPQEQEPQEQEPQEQKEADGRPHESGKLAEQIRFFEVQYDRGSKRYTIKTLRRGSQSWDGLERLTHFSLQDEIFRLGDYVIIKLWDKAGAAVEDEIAYIGDIKTLRKPDQRILVLVRWVYLHGGKYYDSNHLQIILWDTIDRRADTKQVKRIYHDRVYDACLRARLCNQKESDMWQMRLGSLMHFGPC